MRHALVLITALVSILGTSCTGGSLNGSINGMDGTIKIQPGQQLAIHTDDVKSMGVTNYSLSLRAVSADYSSSTILYDLTADYQAAGSPLTYNLVIPRSVTTPRPMLVVIDMPDLNSQLIDVVYDGDTDAQPGIASTLTYTLLKYYPNSSLASFNGTSYQLIQDLIQHRMDDLIADSDYLSYSATPYAKLIRFFTNGLAFNPTFLTAIQQAGVNYGYSLTAPAGILAGDTPEDSLTPYQFATNFTVAGVAAPTNPFNESNTASMLMPGASNPSPGTNLFVSEGKSVSIQTQAFDNDDDYMDKNMIVQYIPRVLPQALTSATGFPFIPEIAPSYITITNMANSDAVDNYLSDTIGYNEALDLTVYATTLPYDTTLYPTATQVDTAYRNVYYLITDGMVRVPYHWNFKYSDMNRQPVIVTDALGNINNTSLDSTIAAGETEVAPGTGWLVHGSHCESDPSATYTGTDPNTGQPTFIYYEVIKAKSDGPWSCVFRVTDPDIDADPNAAADTFYYTVNMTDNSTIVNFGLPSQKLWPVYVGPPYTPNRYTGTTIQNCVTPDGVTHPRCGQALYQVTIDNSVKAAAESKSNLEYSYGVTVYDRAPAIGGYSTSHTISREIQIPPNPAFLIDYSAATPPSGTASLATLTNNSSNQKIYLRQTTFMSEIMGALDPTSSDGGNLSAVGLGGTGMTSPVVRTANRGLMMAGTAQPMSNMITQPYSIQGGTLTWNNSDPTNPVPANATPGSIVKLGLGLTSSTAATFGIPHEYDSTCKLAMNNQNSIEGWSQTSLATGTATSTQTEGWVFEVDAVDYDNTELAVGEASDPVYVTLSSDVNIALNSAGFQACTYLAPNSDPAYYQTYSATANAAAVNADTCSWSATVPLQMQPIPVYYQVTEGGIMSVKKYVYHRLRFKWQPKDQGLTNGKTVADPAGFIQNMIKSGMQTSGQRFQSNGEPMDQNTVTSPLTMFAVRKDMTPCLSGLVGNTAPIDVIHQIFTAPLTAITFNVKDENQVLIGNSGLAGALNGRYEAELKLLGSRTVSDPEFLKWVLFSQNCSIQDKVTPTGASPTPPPTKTLSEPMIWYTEASDTNDTPRVRFQTQTDPNPAALKSEACMDFQMSPLQNVSGIAYNEVILIQNLSTAPFTLTNSVLSACTARTSLNLNPDQKYIAIASTCGASHTLSQSLWSDSNSAAIAKYILDPTSASLGGFPLGTNMSLDMFPSMFQSDVGTSFPAAYSEPNGLFFDAYAFDTFRLDPNLKVPVYTGYVDSSSNPIWLPNNSTNAVAYSTLTALPSPGYSYSIQAVDWDNQPNYLSLATPTPNAATSNVFFRMAPGDSSRIQVYVKNNAAVSFPIKVADTTGTLAELDPYDVMEYNLLAPAATPAAAPNFVGVGHSTCKEIPSGYPSTLSTLNVSTLANYKQCTLQWNPATADNGHKYSYQFEVQDNFSSSWTTGALTTMGYGGRHPSGTNSGIPNDSLTPNNGPVVVYNLDIEALETNTAPYFTSTLGGSTITSPYNPSGGASGWTSVFPSSTPTAGKAPTCSGTQSPPSYDMTATSFTCALAMTSGDTLESATAVTLTEGSQNTFTVYAKDDNVTVPLKTLSATKPTQVYIIDGPHAGHTYTVPSFASMVLTQSPNATSGTATFSFSWTPTDSEANFLSTAGGFLIPVVISDQPYTPASDSSFPTQFTVAAMQNTVWIWAKVNVKNNAPSVYYLSGTGATATEVPLQGATLTMQTGTSTSVTLRVKDTDVARWRQSGNYTSFALNYTGPTFTAPSPAGTPYYTTSGSNQYIVQEIVVTGTPANADIGSYSSPNLNLTDPGDPSLGLAINPNTSTPPWAMLTATSNQTNTNFNIQVIGKPIFLAPSATNYNANAFATKSFYYPTSMFVSRPTEKLQSFFVGIDSTTTVTPLRTTAAGTGIYVNEKYVVRWPDSTVLNSNGAVRTVPIYGVVATVCSTNAALASPAKTLIRYNETTAKIETCKLTATDVSGNAASTSLAINLLDSSQYTTTGPSITLTEGDRTYAPTTAPTSFTTTTDQQFSDFYARCANCSVSPILQNAGPVTQNVSTTAWQLNAYSGMNGSAEYDYASYVTRFEFYNSPYSVNKIYRDQNPNTSRKLTFFSNKDETITFNASTSTASAPYYQYRWYVNGCLTASGLASGANISFSQKISSLASGANNDCTGQYNFAETGATALGKLIVRLSIDNGTEAISATSDPSTNYYIWNVNVINTDPTVVTTSGYLPSNPVVFSSTYMAGDSSIQFATPVTFSAKNYLAYTDLSSTAGLKVKLREFNANGDFASGGSLLTLTCDASLKTQPVWMGIQPNGSTSLSIAASTNNSYPISTSANLTYGQKGTTCYATGLSTSTTSQTGVVYAAAGSTVPAGYLAFSSYNMSVRATANYSTTTNGYASPTYDTNYYFIDGSNATNQFWSYPISTSPMYTSTPTSLSSTFPNNTVRKSIVSGTNIFQFIGAPANSSTGWRGYVQMGTIAQRTGSTNLITVTPSASTMFSDGTGTAPTPSANDCHFNGTPLDGVYVAATSTLYVVAQASDITGYGHLVAIKNPLSAPVCSVIGNIMNPSLSASDHNPNISKVAYDVNNGMIYGVISQGTGSTTEFFSYDIYGQNLATRDLSASISSYELVTVPNTNATYLFDNRKTTTGTLYTPTLYKVW